MATEVKGYESYSPSISSSESQSSLRCAIADFKSRVDLGMPDDKSLEEQLLDHQRMIRLFGVDLDEASARQSAQARGLNIPETNLQYDPTMVVGYANSLLPDEFKVPSFNHRDMNRDMAVVARMLLLDPDEVSPLHESMYYKYVPYISKVNELMGINLSSRLRKISGYYEA